MPTKLNRAGKQQPYIPEGNGDASGEYAPDGSTPAERERLQELGIDDKKDFLNSDKREYKSLKSFNNYFSKNKDEFNQLLLEENKWLGSVGSESQILKDVLDEIGYLSKPKIVSKNEFDKLKKDGATVLYRGVTGLTNASQQLRDSEKPFVGRGARLHGMYFSKDYEIADSYTKDKGSVAEAVLNPNANIITIDELENIDHETRMDIITDNISDEFNSFDKDNVLSYFNDKKGRIRAAIEAAMLGYDAVDMGHDNIVLLNRGALIMKGD